MRKMLPLLLLLASAAGAKEARRGYLGVVPAPLDAETREMHKIPPETTSGVVIAEVLPDTAAARAGIRAGDVLVYLDRVEVNDVDRVRALVAAHREGDTVTFAVRRGSERIEGTVTLGAWPEEAPFEVEEGDATGRSERLARLRREAEELRRRVEARIEARAHEVHDPLAGFLHREERLLEEARKAADPKRAAFHEARLDLLRELRRELPAAGGFRIEGPAVERRIEVRRLDGAGPFSAHEERLARLERKVDEILELLRHPPKRK